MIEKLKLKKNIYFLLNLYIIVKADRKGGDLGGDKYLGLLTPMEDYRVYGYITLSNIKFIMITADVSLKNENVRNNFELLHDLYVQATCNPFYKEGDLLTSKVFDNNVAKLVKEKSRFTATR